MGILGSEGKGRLAKRVTSIEVLVFPNLVEATAEDEVQVAEDLLALAG